MPLPDPAFWSDYLRRTLRVYDESLLRRVATNLVKPRSQWPVDELIDRSLVTLANAAVLDRRLQALDVPCRRLITCLARSRQPRWKLGNLLELLAALGATEGPSQVFALFDAGLLFPDLLAGTQDLLSNGAGGTIRNPRLRSFEQWLAQAGPSGFAVFAHPGVLARAVGGDLGLPVLQVGKVEAADPGGPAPSLALPTPTLEADGLEWLLRLAVLWQQLVAAPLRQTQQGGFFKRDLDRLQADPLLTAPPADSLAEVPDAGLLMVALAQAEGILQADDSELRAGTLPAYWDEGLSNALASLWAAVPLLESWNPRNGWVGTEAVGNPYPTACLLSLLLLAELPPEAWARPADLETWILEHHPYWTGESVRPSQQESWVPAFLLGFAYPLRLLQATKDPAGGWLIRLSALGRWLLGIGELPAVAVPFAQTLLVQPNLEIVVYRQALTPALIGRLSRFAVWKTLGSACTLQLEADAVYRGLESGLSFEAIAQTLEQYGMRATPPAVVESLRTWANKRERITVYPTATLFEFGSADGLNEALARGLPGVRLTDRLLVVAGESDIDYRHFRLTGTRDYSQPPERCVELEGDGVTLGVDLARSDLLLETEIQRFAEAVDGVGVNGRRRYRLTPGSLAGLRDGGLDLQDLEEWCLQRTGQPLSPAARLLLNGARVSPPELRMQLILHVATAEVAEGLLQWPGTRALIRGRLGPTALVVAEEDVEALKEKLAGLGIVIN
jgi:hypothetical protein